MRITGPARSHTAFFVVGGVVLVGSGHDQHGPRGV
jgi:hypothetical protein